MVLFCFNQVGNSYGLFLPRLVDTLIGALIAGLAVIFILPDWQGRRLNQVVANTLACNSRYLRQIMQQYASGKRDDLAYRLARRNAHNADAALSTTLSNMLMEPGHFRKEADVGFRFLVLSHTLLSYLSALGAHRSETPGEALTPTINEAAEQIAGSLDCIAQGLAERRPISIYRDEEDALAKALEQLPEDMDDRPRLVQTELGLICRQLGALRTLAAHLLNEGKVA
ncbi:Inner membrane protein YccS [compost metagenome]